MQVEHSLVCLYFFIKKNVCKCTMCYYTPVVCDLLHRCSIRCVCIVGAIHTNSTNLQIVANILMTCHPHSSIPRGLIYLSICMQQILEASSSNRTFTCLFMKLANRLSVPYIIYLVFTHTWQLKQHQQALLHQHQQYILQFG